jgi:tetratricopeptide (TPR) repeat protein
MQGGTKAKRRGDLRAAFAFFRRALAIAETIDLPPGERLVTRGLTAHARMTIEASQEVLDEIATLVTELRALPPTAVLVELLEVLSHDVSDKDLAAATALDQEAIATARAIGDADTIANALLQSAWAWWVQGDLGAQRRALLEALQHIEATGAERQLGTVLGWLGANTAFRGAFVESGEYAVRANERAASSGSSLQRAEALRGVVFTALGHGELDVAVRVAKEAVDAAIDAGALQDIGSNYGLLGIALHAAGEFGQAREAHERAINRLAGPPLRGFRAEARTQLVKTLVSLGEISEARRQAETARAEVAASDVYTIATTTAALAAVCAAERAPEEAERLYRQALEGIGPSGYVLLRMQMQRDFASFVLDRGRAAEARPLLEEVRDFFDTPVTPFERQRTEALLRRCAAVPR